MLVGIGFVGTRVGSVSKEIGLDGSLMEAVRCFVPPCGTEGAWAGSIGLVTDQSVLEPGTRRSASSTKIGTKMLLSSETELKL